MDTLTIQDFKKILQAALEAVRAREQEFSELDAVTGDGDHGTAIVQAMTSVVEAAGPAQEFKQMFNDISFNIMLQTSGSTSTLLGGFFLGLADHSSGESMTADQVKQAFMGALDGVKKQTKATVGDKTMMDALQPAVNAIAASTSGNIAEIMQEGAAAAIQGAKATINMKANFGRARNYGEKSIGFMDSGASSWSCMFNAFAQALQ
ncbi:DAK2 domain-containing protein [Akkermansia sp. N21116]|mgnify:FL=1|uniref:DAK2 domain-containing protein n=1 Tax=Akkermansia sp. N21116 TaxID=3040764 RepID=UPI00244E6390|nr:DAK2 domain-containing protein [Akkermansia sp. N21116]WPX41400.1 DAK2 domain-containing protein [Akkermansia sp. N21116]